MFDNPHKRKNPLTGEWVLVSPHRTKRPWQGQKEDAALVKRPEYDSGCYLCPGNERAGGEKNPHYKDTFAFTNDFSALLADTPDFEEESPLFSSRSEKGICRVICFSPRHDLTMAKMEPAEALKVVDLWAKEYSELGSQKGIEYVQIFENRGAAMGCSNPHPHGQIWASSSLPDIPEKEDNTQKEYAQTHGSCLLCDYVKEELKRDERIVFQNDSFLALVPFWAVWPFETMLLPKRHLRSIDECTPDEKKDLAEALVKMGIRFDNLFKTDFPYSMGIHQQPTDGKENKEWHFHIHYYPPLLRSATVKKFMVGYEMMANPQRDITAEKSAEMLRSLSDNHFTKEV